MGDGGGGGGGDLCQMWGLGKTCRVYINYNQLSDTEDIFSSNLKTGTDNLDSIFQY